MGIQPSKRNADEMRDAAGDYIDKILKAEGSKEGSGFSEVTQAVIDGKIDAQRAEAICMLGDNACLKKISFDKVVAAGSEYAVTTAKEIVHGLQNLRSLEKYGMNTSENQSKVISAGEKATQTSLDLWEARKEKLQLPIGMAELQKAARKSGHSSLHNNPAARYAAKTVSDKNVIDQVKEVDASLNRPGHSEKFVPRSPSANRGG